MVHLDEKYIDVIREFVNIGMGQSADTLNQIINCHIKLNVPEIRIIDYSCLKSEIKTLDNQNHVAVSLKFKNDLNGIAKLIFPTESATKLVKLFVGDIEEDDTDMDGLRISALTEIGNIIINSIIGTISNHLDVNITYTVPEFVEGDLPEVTGIEQDNSDVMILFCKANFNAEEVHISGSLVLYFNIGQFKDFISIIDNYYDSIELK